MEKYLIIIDINIIRSKPIKYKTYILIPSRETKTHYYFYSNSKNSVYRRAKNRCNTIVQRNNKHYEYAITYYSNDINVIKSDSDIINIVSKIADKLTISMSKSFENLQKIKESVNML